jgi:hypothetical protein
MWQSGTFISCDPGLKGAFVFWRQGKPVRFELMPLNGNQVSVAGLVRIFKTEDHHLVLEGVGGIMGQSASASFNFGRGVGTIYGAAIALEVGVEEIRPQVWQAIAHRGLPKAMPPKDRSRAAVERLFPAFNTIPERCRVPHEGVVDALLIGYAALERRTHV